MFQESELINLLAVFIALIIIFFVSDRTYIQQIKSLCLGFYLILAAYVFTVVEGIFWNDFFNFLEHLCYALAGLAFVFACRQLLTVNDKGKEPR